tara:strand:+ start:1928 stop:2455 length:528 start_codon:yes stop_codon:yes gene_type:complete
LRDADVGKRLARIFKTCHLLMSEFDLYSTSYLILGRTNYLGFQYENMYRLKKKIKDCFTPKDIAIFRDFDSQVRCQTTHGSKGEEADVVIILNVIDGKMPLLHPDNNLYQILGATKEEEYNEERRLFYVAMTRAKKQLYLLTEEGRHSPFLERINYKEFDIDHGRVTSSANRFRS